MAEPDVPDTIAILRGLNERYEVHHGVDITDAAAEARAVNAAVVAVVSRPSAYQVVVARKFSLRSSIHLTGRPISRASQGTTTSSG